MDTREMLDTIYSFVSGFGTREIKDAQNAIFVAKELFNLDLPLKFKGMGRVGVEWFPPFFKANLYIFTISTSL